MRISRASQRLAARAHARQVEVSRRADDAATLADHAVLRMWRRILDLLHREPQWGEACRHAAGLFSGMQTVLRGAVVLSLTRQAAWGWRSAVAAVSEALPRKTLARVVVAAPVQEARLLEDDSSADLAFIDILDLIFPPPSEDFISHVIYGGDWQARLAATSRLAPPAILANILAGGLAAGKSQQEIARDLMPAVQNVRVSARRIARTESLRVAGAMQMQAHQQLGDLVVGYQVHATLDQHTRPWHRARDGTIYYLDPKPGEKGPAQMPNPPDEPADPSERPLRTPATAWNCRCFLTPVLRS